MTLLQAGIYTLSLTSSNAMCSNVDSTHIVVLDAINASFSHPVGGACSCFGGNFNSHKIAKIARYSWWNVA